jgi:hypothetical protein
MVQFRYPSPGNRKPVQIPTADENDNNPYFVAHYVRDTTHQGTDPFFFILNWRVHEMHYYPRIIPW